MVPPGIRGWFPAVFLVTVGVVGYVVWRKWFRKYRAGRNVEEERSPLLGMELNLFSSGRIKRKLVTDFNWSDKLTFMLNGQYYELVNPDPSQLLASYIRDTVGLKGTKLGCEEGGCGACTIVLEDVNGKTVAANSCLRLLCANDGLTITTVEGIGSVKGGLSEEQKRLVSNNGTQCGFCTPGWITAMHALRESSSEEGQSLSKPDIDQYFDGNICRCTGYRPIMQAFHSFCGEKKLAVSCHQPGDKCSSMGALDIEDFRGQECPSHIPSTCNSNTVAINPKKSTLVKKSYSSSPKGLPPRPLYFHNPATGKKYYRPLTLEQLGAIFLSESTASALNQIKLVGGNTSIGITKYFNDTQPYYVADDYKIMVDINMVPELHVQSFDVSNAEINIGAAISINQTIALLKQHAASSHVWGEVSGDVNHASVFSATANHLSKIANTQVRNMGSWAGNLMTFLQYSSFPSDAVLAFTTANGRLVISNGEGELTEITMADFLGYSWDEFRASGKFIVSIKLRESSALGLVRSMMCTNKVAQREHNAHAYVNAGFHFKLAHRTAGNGNSWLGGAPICREARIVYGGVSKKTFIATRTERVLSNASLTAATLSQALQALQTDLVAAGINETFENPAFLISIMQSNLYQAFLRSYPPGQLPPNTLSAVLPWTKPASRGVEVYPIDRNDNPLAPVGQAVTKLEAPIQATGEAVYPSDETMPAQGLHGALVYSTQCMAILNGIDVSSALSIPGVVSVLTAADIPGSNSLANGNPLFVALGGSIDYVGAPLAVVVATSEAVANQAAAVVRITYASTGQVPITNLTDAIAAQSFFTDLPPEMTHLEIGSVDQALSVAPYRLQGRLSAAGQHHFYMEAQVAVASPENGDCVKVICGTQDPSTWQSNVAGLLGLTSNQVVVQCPRTGGAFGGKLTNGLANAAAAALCASKLGRSVRIFNTRTADMTMLGAREEWLADFDVGFDAQGVIQGLRYRFYLNAGCVANDSFGSLFMGNNWADNAYYLPNYAADSVVCRTNTPSRTAMRAPGVVQSCLFTEMVVERVATALQLPLNTVQERNFIQNGQSAICGQVITDCTLQSVWAKVLARSQYTDRVRRVQQFNANNLWRKRGIAVCPVKYGMGWAGYNAGVWLGARSTDGYVTVTHNGVEMGQGINTKVAQAVAQGLGIPLSLIRVERTRTDGVVNGGPTGGSGTSEVVVKAALNACANLNGRLAPYRKVANAANGKATPSTQQQWLALLQSLPLEVSLNVEGWYSPSSNPNGQPFQYFVYAACVSEVELDVLSGAVHVLASELVYDCGRSLNPAIDIGQIEGALVMGLGYFFSEKVRYEPGSGRLQSVGTWEYKPPLAQDIPSVLNLTLIANAYNKDGILGSKAVGEPPYIVSNSAYFALKMAVGSARADATNTSGEYFDLPVPATIDVRQTACLVNPSRFVLPY